MPQIIFFSLIGAYVYYNGAISSFVFQ